MTTAQEAEWITTWSRILAEEVASDRLPSRIPTRSPAGKALSEIRGQKLREKESLLELLGKRLAPERPRHFRGDVRSTLRCVPKNHELGNIYMTSFHPVFVPTVGALPLKPASDKEFRYRQSQHDRAVEESERQALHRAGADDAGQRSRLRNPSRRDGWIQLDDDGAPYILGLTVLSPRWLGYSTNDHARDDSNVEVAMHLLCRCGTRYAYLQTFREALDCGERIVRV